MTTLEDYIGFLPVAETFQFDNFIISPQPDLKDYCEEIGQQTNEDGFYYPPMSYTERVDLITNKPLERVPRSERPALLFKLPASHKIICSVRSNMHCREKLLGFVVNVLAYLFGIRLQFHDWWFDMRVPLKNQNYSYVTKAGAEAFLNCAVSKWKRLSSSQRHLLNNLFYMHARNPSYQWDWERFMMEYLVFDGCYKFRYGRDGHPHAGRMEKILQEYRMKIYKREICALVKLRNTLFHETLWDGHQPGHGGSNEAFMSFFTLKKINQRLLATLVDYPTKYVETNWRPIGRCLFDDPPIGNLMKMLIR